MEVKHITNNYYTDVTDKSNVSTVNIEQPKTDPIKTYQKEAEQTAKLDHKLSKKEMEHLIANLNEEMSRITTDLKFGFNNTAEMLEVSVINTKTNKIIRKFPTEEAVSLMDTMKKFVGLLFDQKG